MTLRLALIACRYFAPTACLTTVREEHAAFYKRVFDAQPLVEGRSYPGLTVAGCLYQAVTPHAVEYAERRFPFFKSTPFEQRLLFQRPKRGEPAPLSVLPTAKYSLAAAERLSPGLPQTPARPRRKTLCRAGGVVSCRTAADGGCAASLCENRCGSHRVTVGPDDMRPGGQAFAQYRLHLSPLIALIAGVLDPGHATAAQLHRRDLPDHRRPARTVPAARPLTRRRQGDAVPKRRVSATPGHSAARAPARASWAIARLVLRQSCHCPCGRFSLSAPRQLCEGL